MLPYQAFLDGDLDVAAEMLDEVRSASAPPVRLKVILETGAFPGRARIADAASFAIGRGADFVKTSTGKTATSATAEAAEAILGVIRDLRRARRVQGRPAASASLDDAAAYLEIADRIMGPRWASPATFRFGASGLLDALESSSRDEPASAPASRTDRRPMLPQEIIRIKRDGGVLDPAAIGELVARASPTARSPRARRRRSRWRCSSAGMDIDEAVALTQAMQRSGTTLRWDARWPRRRQALDRWRRRHGQPDARADGGRVRRLRADDLRARPRPHRRHVRQDGEHPRLPGRAGAGRVPAGRRRRRLRGDRPDAPSSRRRTSASTASATSPPRWRASR